jgi:deoxyribodipyrimidine photo-lyase
MQEKQTNNKGIGLVWFRNDLRTLDNPSLQKAMLDCEEVHAIYCFDPRHFEITSFGFSKTGVFRAQFLQETVSNLYSQLNALNIQLHIFHDYPEKVIPTFCEQNKVITIYCQYEWTSEEKKVTEGIKKILPTVSFVEHYRQFLYNPEVVFDKMPTIPAVFTQFRTKLEKTISLPNAEIHFDEVLKNKITHEENFVPTLQQLYNTEKDFSELLKPNPKSAFPFKGGETHALQRLQNYLFETKCIATYKETRNGLVGLDYSSKFSPWLANGSLSAQTIYAALKMFEKEVLTNESTYWLYFELLWRDYFKFISLQHGNAFFKLGGLNGVKPPIQPNHQHIENWINGNTDDDFVNANMIELKTTGWMSNRGRQNVASYFCKELLQDWRIGAAYFESALLDYDVHSNYGNWQYLAGVGNDPRSRKFNTQLQANSYDPHFVYRKQWLRP